MPSTPPTAPADPRKTVDPAAAAAFRDRVYAYFQEHGRRFPWRDVTDPYDIAVSEIMLQQTQADRVVPKYQAFMRAYPSVGALAEASLGDVLGLWSGLGYNRRAKLLRDMAQAVVDRGGFPGTVEGLRELPGVGPYTAAAIAAFAYNQPVVVNETNIRSVYIHEFFGDAEGVHDRDLEPLIAATLDRDNPRDWYQALMDYGAMLKKTGINPGRRSAHYVRQAPLAGSNREARGAVLRVLLGRSLSMRQIWEETALAPERLAPALEGLVAEGFLTVSRGKYSVA
jgi:A/G-specific adenine glycosylase